jgi:hypothetical protein
MSSYVKQQCSVKENFLKITYLKHFPKKKITKHDTKIKNKRNFFSKKCFRLSESVFLTIYNCVELGPTFLLGTLRS